MADWQSEESAEHLLKRAYLAMRSRTDHLLAGWGLTLPQAEVLAYLWRSEGLCLRDLGNSLGTQPATLKGILDGLERRGLVRRTGDLKDGRLKHLELTTEGRRLQVQVPDLCAQVQERALQGLPPEAVQTFEGWLRQIVRNLEGASPKRDRSPLWDMA